MVRIRLSLGGAKKRPFYYLTVADQRKPRDGRFIERIGFYNPLAADHEEKLRVDLERFDYWLSVGGIPSDRVKALVRKMPQINSKKSTEAQAKTDSSSNATEQAQANSDQIEETPVAASDSPIEEAEETPVKASDSPVKEAEETPVKASDSPVKEAEETPVKAKAAVKKPTPKKPKSPASQDQDAPTE